MANQQRKPGPERLGGALPPSSGGYGDIDHSPERADESNAPAVRPQEPRAPEQEQPACSEPPASDAPVSASPDETDPEEACISLEAASLVTDGLDG